MSDKPHQPTRKRLEDRRKRGEVVRSQEVVSALVFTCMVGALSLTPALWMDSIRAGLAALSRVLAAPEPGKLIGPLVTDMVLHAAGLAIGIIALSGVIAAFTAFAQVGALMSLAKVSPDVSRLNPANGLTRMFSMRNLAGLGLMVLKVLCLLGILFVVGAGAIDALLSAGRQSPAQILHVGAHVVLVLLSCVAIMLLVLAAADYMVVRAQYLKEARMTTEEIRREYRENEGDPHLRARRRQLAREAQWSALPDRIQLAVVVVYSPRYAVALWYGGQGTLPVVVARGEGEMAERIRKLAEAQLIQTHGNPGLASKLYEQVQLDAAIDRTLFREVAETLRWATGASQTGG